MVAPLIGITTSVTVDKIPERAYVNGTYIRAVQAAGGIPVLLTPHFTPDVQAAPHVSWWTSSKLNWPREFEHFSVSARCRRPERADIYTPLGGASFSTSQ